MIASLQTQGLKYLLEELTIHVKVCDLGEEVRASISKSGTSVGPQKDNIQPCGNNTFTTDLLNIDGTITTLATLSDYKEMSAQFHILVNCRSCRILNVLVLVIAMNRSILL